MKRRMAIAAALMALAFGRPVAAQAPEWSPKPWLADLAQMRSAIDTKYANIEWLRSERELDVDGLFDRAAAVIANAGSDAQARAVFDRVVQRFGDGHVSISWPRPNPPAASGPASAAKAAPMTAESFCRARGYDSGQASAGLGSSLEGYVPIESGQVLPAGTVTAGGARVGVVRIGVFQPQGFPSLCAEAVSALKMPLDAPCDASCEDAVITHAYRGLTAALEDRLTRLRSAGAEVLVVDITGNGGGSEWTEAAARMVSSRRLTSAPLGFVRGAHWEKQWRELGEKLRGFAAKASGAERTRLLAWAAEADSARAEAARTCPPSGDPGCPWLGRAGYSTGLVGSVPADAFIGKEWEVYVFNPGQHRYRDGVWTGQVVVLTDQETWSAAEQFAALLQDNRAALIVGARTGGSGCGHTWGGTPTTLSNSGAVLKLPDCVRFRADGSNEVRGIIPDLLLPWRANDGRAFRARMLAAALPEAVARARALHREPAR
ncbi:MAG TPA: S41 family peptidase [Allosphingosinicella sp.]|nr:S41 family peptidase [Allosphingosinicella sp.]